MIFFLVQAFSKLKSTTENFIPWNRIFNFCQNNALSGCTVDSILSRDRNNFDLVRLLAAIAVMFGHAFSLQSKSGVEDAFQDFMGGTEYTGSLGVYAFFLLSGILVTKSLDRKKSAIYFIILRFARIWPGLVVCLFVTMFFIVPIASGLDWARFIARSDVRHCFVVDAVVVHGLCLDILNIFPASAVTGGYNYPLWTLPIEIHCYLVVLIIGLSMKLDIKSNIKRRLVFLCLVLACVLAFLLKTMSPPHRWDLQAEFTIMAGYSSYPVLFFLIGMVIYVFSPYIRLNLFILALFFVIEDIIFRTSFLYITYVYLILNILAWKILRFTRPLQDYSYGIYIYGFVIQQAVANRYPTMNPYHSLLISIPVTLGFAVLSWNLVEKRMIDVANGWVGRDGMMPFRART